MPEPISGRWHRLGTGHSLSQRRGVSPAQSVRSKQLCTEGGGVAPSSRTGHPVPVSLRRRRCVGGRDLRLVAASKGQPLPLDLHSPSEFLRWFARHTKRLVVLLLGFAVLGAGVTMLVLPGPGVLVIVVGLAILATEFAWAERALDRTTTRAAKAASSVSASTTGKLALGLSAASMVVGGGLVVALFGEHRLYGATIVMAGVIGLATLLPRVQQWVELKANGRA